MSETTTVEFFFDIGSPYSYLASTQIDDLEEETGADVEWRPFLLGGVFKETGNEPPAGIPAKAQYMQRDLQRWARHYGIEIGIPSSFPTNTLEAQRTLVAIRDENGAVDEAATRLFRALWVEDRAISEDDVLAEVLDDAGFDGGRLVDRTDEPSVKQRLREATDAAVDRGAFGAPTFFVDDEMFWGNDRLHFVEEAIREA